MPVASSRQSCMPEENQSRADDIEIPDREDVEIIETQEELLAQEPLVELFGPNARAKILTILIKSDQPLNPTSIVEKAHVSRNAWYDHRDALLETGIIERVGEAGNSPLYNVPDPNEDQRVAWLRDVSDWTGAYLREQARPSADLDDE